MTCAVLRPRAGNSSTGVSHGWGGLAGKSRTNSRKTASTALRWSARALALAAAYFVVAEIGLRYASIGPSISPVWPPTGLAVAALVLLGPGYWPAILVGAFLANAATSIPVP